MALYGDITREIDVGTGGPRIGAFFDLDRTLIAGFSALDFFRDGWRSGWVSPADVATAVITATRFQMGQTSFSGLVAGTAGLLRGRAEVDLTAMGERLFRERLAPAIYPESRALVEAHRRKGHTMAIVSAATPYQIEPLARSLGVEHVLCTKLQVRAGRFTGGLVRPLCYGEGKAEAVRRLARRHRIDLSQSYFYTDSDEDLPLLEIVGRPRPTNPNRRLRQIAASRGWPARRFRSRGTPGASEVMRTSLALGSLLPSFLLALPAAALGGSWRQGINVAMATWGELGTALAGIDLRVSGEQHLWSKRPAVFIFNHQSGIEMLLLCRLLRRDMIGIAKQEIRQDPLLGPVFAMAGTVFIDRFNHDKAIAALQPAIDQLRSGLSIAIAPEGTRSPTPHLGRFKKGAFHLAMAAKVPLVPIVFRNTLDALPKHAVVIRPATIEVVVHPPISTTRWSRRRLDDHIASVERLYRETLGV
jgi:putative phosphoserine phosphatase/1-acylglycerol-3-phosphate O-acyltransferase